MNRIARLARDVSPWIIGWMVFMLLTIGLIDFAWMRHPSLRGAPLVPGMMLFLMATLTAQKLPLWRTLPVSRRQIDLARWWQAVGITGLLLATVLLAIMAWRAAHDLPHPDLADVLLLALAQSALGTLYAAAIFVIIPWAARHVGRFAAALAAPLVLLPFLLARTMASDISLQKVLWIMAPAGVVVAALLYASAGRWPEPLATGIWGAANTKSESRDRRGASGWFALAAGLLPALAWCWGLAAAVPILFHLLVPRMPAGLFGWFVSLAAMQIVISGLAVAMRPLRALPLAGMALVLQLALVLLVTQAISLAVYEGVLVALGQKLEVILFLVPLALPLVYFAAALRFGLKVVQFGYGLIILATIPLQLVQGGTHLIIWSAGIAILLLALGLWWMSVEILRGNHAWRVQPIQQQRFRGR